jgi:hypothetical protein
VRRPRRGEGLVDLLLVATLVALGCIVAAGIFLPDFQRGVQAIARDIEARWFPGA